jgi:Prp8 binding protein
VLLVLWRTYGNCENYGLLTGHRGAVLDLQWSRDSTILFSASADTHLASWDLESGTRIRRYIGHEGIVNTMDISRRGEETIISGGDDGTIGIWDPRTKNAVGYIETDYPVTAVAVSEAGSEIYSGSIDGDIRAWDMRNKAQVFTMVGPQDTDTITSLRVSPDSQSLLSFSMDGAARTWDIRPFAPTERLIRTFDGASRGLENNLIRASWDAKGKRLAAGSGDGSVHVWSNDTGKLLYKLPGHKGTVNCAEFSPGTEPISTCFLSFMGFCLTDWFSSPLRIHGSHYAAWGAKVSSIESPSHGSIHPSPGIRPLSGSPRLDGNCGRTFFACRYAGSPSFH